MMHPDSVLLMKAILAAPPEAEAYWRRWRSEISLDTMSEDCVRLLPVLAPSSAWLTNDPARNLIVGISKRAWTRNQVMLRLLADALALLERRGMSEVIAAGPPAWAFVRQNAGSFRPVSYLELLVRRAQAVQAVTILSESGWMPLPQSISPEGGALDYVPGIWLKRNSAERLRLNWRLFPAPPEFAAAWESLPPGEQTQFQGTGIALLPNNVMLASALAGDRPGDDLDWRCDAALLLRGPKIDWSAVARYIRFAPEARTKLATLARETGLPVPAKLQRKAECGPVRAQWDFVWREYQTLTWTHGQPRSFRGFLRFLRQRWQAPTLLLPFFGLFYMARYALGGRTGNGQ